jgi:hypothetical protein
MTKVFSKKKICFLEEWTFVSNFQGMCLVKPHSCTKHFLN